jgi:hypothetical protein
MKIKYINLLDPGIEPGTSGLAVRNTREYVTLLLMLDGNFVKLSSSKYNASFSYFYFILFTFYFVIIVLFIFFLSVHTTLKCFLPRHVT